MSDCISVSDRLCVVEFYACYIATGKGGRKVQVNSKGFLLCPKCRKATKTKVLPETALKHFPLFCPWCKKEFIIDK